MVTSGVRAVPDPYAPPAEPAGSDPGPLCLNCGKPAPDAYCPSCGQEQRGMHRPLRTMAAEALDDLAGWDGKIPLSLWTLLRHPGRLTAEFLAGRRARYLRPLRLYLTMSVAFFLSLSLLPSRDRGAVRIGFGGDPAARAAGSPPGRDVPELGDSAFLARRPGEGTGGVESQLKHTFKERLRALNRLSPEERSQRLSQAFVAKLGKMFFALVPVFALLVRGVYFRAPMFYAEHLVFSLHAHAFFMAALTARHLLPDAVGPLVGAWAVAYVFVALRRVYGGSRRRTAGKLLALGAAYCAALIVATSVTAVLALMLG